MNFNLEPSTDDEFFGTLERSRTNLGKLFGVEINANDEQQTLKYQPTTQPSSASVAPSIQTWNTQLAKVASAFRQGNPAGKVGVALLQNVEGATKVIIYKNKANVLATCTVYIMGVKCAQIHRQNHYLQLYDDDGCYWSLYFDKEVDEQDFVAALKDSNVQIYDEVVNDSEGVKQSEVPSKETLSKLDERITAFKEAEKMESETAAIKDTPSKSSLITRMAKVGQQLPLHKPLTVSHNNIDFTDSSDTEVITTPMASRSDKPTIASRSSKLLAKGQIVQLSNVGLSSTVASNTASVNAIETQFVQMLLTENRTQNTEMRMNMSKLESKIEKVIDRIDTLHAKSNRSNGNKEDEMLELEEKLLELKKENRRMKQALEIERVNSENNMLTDLLNSHNQELQAIGLINVENFDALIVSLLERLSIAQKNLEKYAQQIAENAQNESDLNAAKADHCKAVVKILELEDKIKTLDNSLTDKINEIENLQGQLLTQKNLHSEQLQQTRQQIESKEQAIVDLEQQLLKQAKLHAEQVQQLIPAEGRVPESIDLQQQLEQQTKLLNEQLQQQKQLIEATVKAIMNNLYSSLAAKVENTDNMQKNAIIAVIGKTIREETLKAMKQIKE